MFKSLSLRIVMTFISAVFVGLGSSIIITGYLFKDQIAQSIQRQYVMQSQLIAEYFPRLTPSDQDAFLRQFSYRQKESLWIYDSKGLRSSYGSMNGQIFSDEEISRVRDGDELVRSISILPLPTSMYLGVPLQMANERMALIIHPESSEEILKLRGMLYTLILITLVIGSLKFVFFTTLLVKPLKALTAATKKIAKGDYNIHLQTKSKDELGDLSQHFQQMAHDLHHVEEMRQEFVSNVSHEIQTPLASISGFISILQTDGLHDAERIRCLEIIRRESIRLSRLSENMLRLAALDSKHPPYHPAFILLDRQLRHIVVAAEPQWAAKRIEIRLNVPKTTIKADEELLDQVWQNIFHNSIQFTPEGGSIAIGIRSMTGEIAVTFQDTGIGIAEEDRKRIFERFFKADKSHNREAGGSGLGLAIVRRVVDLHWGRIEVDSTPGEGTTVTIFLPAG